MSGRWTLGRRDEMRPLPRRLPKQGPEPDLPVRAATFDDIYRAHVRTVARWAERMGGPRVDADEVVQEVFLTVSRRYDEFRGDAKLTTWLFRITRRVVANHRRAARRRRLWARLTNRISEVAAWGGPAPSDALEGRQAGDRLQRALDALPERHRIVLVLFELEEMSTDEIARFIDRPPATIRVWLHRARARFTALWEAQEDDDDGDDDDDELSGRSRKEAQ
jgi:RNA polymerase sigma-70 factor (ECF subfamily)